MRKSIFKSLATAATIALSSLGVSAAELGSPAPAFEAPSTKGTIRLKDYVEKSHVVLAFYFADFTPT